MKRDTSISVIIPAYNREDTIGAAIDSVVRQSSPVCEIIVVNDGSTDRTSDAIEQAIAQYALWNGRIIHLEQSNGGKSSALNHAMLHASCEWIAFNDSDDVWLPGKIEMQLATLSRFASCRVCFTDTYHARFGGSTTLEIAGIKLGKWRGEIRDLARILASRSTGIMMQTLLVHHSLMREFGDFDTNLTVSQDTDFLFRLALKSRFCYINEPLVILDRSCLRDNRLTKIYNLSNPARLEEDVGMLETWNMLVPDDDLQLKRAVQARHHALLSALANARLREGDRAGALECLNEICSKSISARYHLKLCMLRCAPSLAKELLCTSSRSRLYGLSWSSRGILK